MLATAVLVSSLLAPRQDVLSGTFVAKLLGTTIEQYRVSTLASESQNCFALQGTMTLMHYLNGAGEGSGAYRSAT